MRYFRRSLTIIMMLLMSWMFVMSSSAVADVSGLLMHQQTQSEQVKHEFSFCEDGACAMSASSAMSCLQHCDHHSILPFYMSEMPAVDQVVGTHPRYHRLIPEPILPIEPKPPKISLLENC